MSFRLRFGQSVPEGAVNLAWVSLPRVSPDKNTFMANLAATMPNNKEEYTKVGLLSGVTSCRYSLGSAVSRTVSDAQSYGKFSKPISVLPPTVDLTGGWRVRVSDGVFSQVIKVEDADKSWIRTAFAPDDIIVAVYTIPEARLSNTPGESVQTTSGEPAFPMSSRVVMLLHSDVVAVHSITVNGQNIDPADSTLVEIDNSEGKITFIQRSVTIMDDIRVSYEYRSGGIIYYGFFDDDGRFKDLDLNPAYGHVFDGGHPTVELLSKVVSLFLIPSAAYRLDDALAGSINIKRAQDYGCYNFVRWGADLLGTLPDAPDPSADQESVVSVPRSTYGRAIYGRHHFSSALPGDDYGDDSFTGSNGSASPIADYPSAAPLARLYVGSTGTVDSVVITDTRVRGGGLPDDPKTREIILSGEQLLESESCWDIGGWDGQATMLNGTVVVELPESLLVSMGGDFTEAQIDAIVKKRLPVGVMPIIKYIAGSVQ